MGKCPAWQQKNRMLTSRHKSALFVLLCVSSSPMIFSFAETEFDTFRTNKPSTHFVSSFQIPRSASLLHLGVQRQLCILSQLWDAKCCLFCFHSEQHAFCMRQHETHSMSEDFIRKSWCCRNNNADANYFLWFWFCFKFTSSMIFSY